LRKTCFRLRSPAHRGLETGLDCFTCEGPGTAGEPNLPGAETDPKPTPTMLCRSWNPGTSRGGFLDPLQRASPAAFLIPPPLDEKSVVSVCLFQFRTRDAWRGSLRLLRLRPRAPLSPCSPLTACPSPGPSSFRRLGTVRPRETHNPEVPGCQPYAVSIDGAERPDADDRFESFA